jgi:hypothetical protein
MMKTIVYFFTAFSITTAANVSTPENTDKVIKLTVNKNGFFSRLCVGYGGSLSHEPKFGFDINTISVITSSFKSRGFES